MKKGYVVAAFFIAVIIIASAFMLSPKKSMVVFHAGSLSIPFDEISKDFENKYDIHVYRQAAGSVATIKKITELGKHADIVASADYTLIQNMMEPQYADYCIQFATNRMVLAYTDKSAYNEEINSSNWYEILKKDGVRFGFSDPNKDPCGYRAMMVMQLSSIYYNKTIFHSLIEKNMLITMSEENGSYIIHVPDSSELSSNEKIMIRPMEVDLMAALETGEIDYLFIYESVAKQHAVSGVKYINLPDAVDLSNPSMAEHYSIVYVERSDGKMIAAKPIVYGITIPKNAEHREYAIKFLEFLLGEDGKNILSKNGQTPLQPAICDHKDLLPDTIKPYVK